jgi:hypothetical protein
MERPKRIAKRLKAIYPRSTLSTCQAVVARLYLHADWHALDQAVKRGDESAPFLEELSDVADIRARVSTQIEILCRELGGVDPNAKDVDPDRTPSLDAISSVREARSAVHYQRMLACDVLSELLPTAIRSPPKQEAEAHLPHGERDIALALPGQIATWWRLNVPHQTVVADQWEAMEIDADSRVSLLRAGAYWGTLCLHYAHTIDWTMVMGVSYLFAARYASILAAETGEFRILAECAGDERRTEAEREAAVREANKLLIDFAALFLGVLARDDLKDVFESQPDAFITNAKTCLTIFANPSSRRGTWKR